MPKQYTKEQFWKLYKNLPQELKNALFSEETSDAIYETCKRNKVPEEKVGGITEYVGHVLLGVLSPDEFQKTLEKELKLKKTTAKKVAQEINRFVFYPVKGALEEIYKIEIKSAPVLAEKKVTPSKEVPTPPKVTDKYREPIEKVTDKYREPIE
ncbi:hypothetical protein J7L36_00965 [bacterium]|nr:hypothetical protein [bacterium]